MKSFFCSISVILLVVTICTAHSTVNDQSSLYTPADSSVSTITPATATSPSQPSPPVFELIHCSLHASIISRLEALGYTIGEGTVLAVGFEHDSTLADQIQCMVVVLAPDHQCRKQQFSVDRQCYEEFAGRKVTSELPTKIDLKPVPATVADTIVSRDDHRQDGRLYFMLNTTFRSFWVYNIGFSNAFHDMNGRVITGISLFTLGGSLYGSYLFSKQIELGYGRVEFMNYGADMGCLLPWLLQMFADPDAPFDETPIGSFGAMLGFPLGIYLGSKLTFASNYDYGNASIMTNLSRTAPLYGFLLPLLVQGDHIRHNSYVQTSSLLSMALVPAGFYLGRKLVGNDHWSSGRSILITTSGIFGALTGLGLPKLWDSDNSRIYSGCVLAGHIAGTWFGFKFRQGTEYSYGQGIFTAASTIVGTGVGCAFPLVMDANNAKAYIAAAMAGGWCGFLLGERLSKSLFEKSQHDTRVSWSINVPGLVTLPLYALSNHGIRTNPQPDMIYSASTPRVGILEVRF